MPRRPRLSTGGLAYHVLNRRVGRMALFENPADYQAFEKILQVRIPLNSATHSEAFRPPVPGIPAGGRSEATLELFSLA